jgi:hypothetical protein
MDEMKKRLEEFFKLCQTHNIVLKKSKSNLLRKDDIALLSFTVSEGKLRPSEKKLDHIKLAENKISTQKDLRALLVALNYYHRFSPRFRFLAQPLFDLLKLARNAFKFEDVHRTMLQDLMKEIKQTPGLSYLNNPKIRNGRYIIYADASNTAMGV